MNELFSLHPLYSVLLVVPPKNHQISTYCVIFDFRVDCVGYTCLLPVPCESCSLHVGTFFL